jgi:transposase-like protein
MRFENLEEAQAYLDRWEERWADTRIHGTTKRQVAVMFSEEKPHLLPLPLEPFRYYQYGERVVHLDGCVEVEAAYYGLPPGWIGRSVKVQWDALHVRILHPSTNQLLREHLRQKRGGYRIQEEDHPKKIPLSTAQLLRRAEHAGTQIGKLCQLLYQQQGATGIRRILGMHSLIKKYGAAAVEDACTTAFDIGVHRRLLYKWRDQFDPLDSGEEAPPGNSRESTLRKEINQLKRVVLDKTLELDFFKGALQKVEARRQKSGISGEKPSTTKSKK